MKQKLYLFALVLLFQMISFGQTLDQSNTNTPGGGVAASDPGEMVGQSFTAGISGTLSKISFYFDSPIATNYNLKVYSGAGNTGVLLGTQYFSVPASTPSGEFEIPISITMNISVGNIYTAYVSRNDMMLPEIIFGTSLGNVYLGGSVYSNNISIPSYDLWFKTFIMPLPVAASYFNFDGIDDRVELSNESNFDFTSTFSMECWIRVNSFTQEWQTIISKGDEGPRIHRFGFTNFIAFGTGPSDDLVSTSSVNDGNWHHIAATCDIISPIFGVKSLYIDGVLQGTQSVTLPLVTNDNNVRIGSQIDTYSPIRAFHGDIDDVRFWNVARTSAEINDSKDCALRGNETNLIAYYKLNQGIAGADNTSITTILDATTFANHGTPQNSVLNGAISNFLAEAAPVPNITYTIVQNNVSCNGLNDGSIIVTPTGGQAPYIFTWSTGSPNGTISNLSPSTYNLYSITDANGCFIGSTNFGMDGNTLQVITMTQQPALGSPTITTPVIYSQGDTASALTAIIGSNGTGLLWFTTATGGAGTSIAPVPSTVNPGNTSYWVSSTNANGCESARTEIIVTINASISGCWKNVYTGGNQTYAIGNDGSLWSWGFNAEAQLGLGDTGSRVIPTQVGTATNWKTLSSGDRHVLAIKEDGTLWVWGRNLQGQLGLGDTSQRSTPTQLGTATNWSKIDCGTNNALAIKTDGTLWVWGLNSNGQLGLGDLTQRIIPTQVGADTDWIEINGSGQGAFAIKSNGTLWGTGANVDGQLGLGDNTDRASFVQIGTDTNWSKVHGGYGAFTLALKVNGSLWATGNNLYGQLGQNNSTNLNVFTQVGTATDWNKFTTATTHSMAIKSNGTLWTWGRNTSGQLGLGDNSNRLVPTQVGTATNWYDISAGDAFLKALNIVGEIWSTGYNFAGQLGLGDTSNRNSLIQVSCPAILSADDFSITNKITIYPNPSNGIYTIGTLENVTIEVYDMIGKKISSKSYNVGVNQLDITNFANGIYLVNTITDNGITTAYKVIKQ